MPTSFFPIRPLPPITTIFMASLLLLVTGHWSLAIGHWPLVTGHCHSGFFSGIAIIVASRGCSTTAMTRVLPLADGFFDTRCRHPVGS